LGKLLRDKGITFNSQAQFTSLETYKLANCEAIKDDARSKIDFSKEVMMKPTKDQDSESNANRGE